LTRRSCIFPIEDILCAPVTERFDQPATSPFFLRCHYNQFIMDNVIYSNKY